MALPSPLVENYHEVSIGSIPLLSLDGLDCFPDGAEPSLSHQPEVETPAVSGQNNGLIFNRGNVRWTASISRVRNFTKYTYPGTHGGITASSPEQYAQLWLVEHMKDLASASGDLQWNDESWGSACVTPNGTTECGWVIMEYQIQMAKAPPP